MDMSAAGVDEQQQDPDIQHVNESGQHLLPDGSIEDAAPEQAAEPTAEPEHDDTQLNEAQAVAYRQAEVAQDKEKDRIQAEQDEEAITAREAAREERDRIAFETTIARRKIQEEKRKEDADIEEHNRHK